MTDDERANWCRVTDWPVVRRITEQAHTDLLRFQLVQPMTLEQRLAAVKAAMESRIIFESGVEWLTRSRMHA